MRIRLTLWLLLVTVYGVLPAWPQAPAGSQLLVLTNANVIDGVSEKPIRQATVIVRDGKIVSVAKNFSQNSAWPDGRRFER